ncbi:MAG: hypothetical protein GKR91_02545 [Pseudomonadales bacterium]|nr:hypothetical protein [Pseudomonadales bacterium]
MEVIAVAQLDRLICKIERMDSRKSLEVLLNQTTLLKQCHNVDHWVFMADVEGIKRVPPQIQDFLGIKLVTSLKGDPLDEFYQAASIPRRKSESPFFNPTVVRVIPGANEPDPDLIDAMIENHRDRGLDYCRSEASDDGLNPFIELMSFSSLDEAWREALLPDDRENITPYIYRQHQRLNVGTYRLQDSQAQGFQSLLA